MSNKFMDGIVEGIFFGPVALVYSVKSSHTLQGNILGMGVQAMILKSYSYIPHTEYIGAGLIIAGLIGEIGSLFNNCNEPMHHGYYYYP